MSVFRAYRIFEENGKSQGRFVELSLDDLDPGEVVIRAHYSSVNYKDALAATGAGKVIRRFPCVGGVDVAGVVESSADARFKTGDEVLVTGYGMGVEHDGGYAEFVRAPADWVVPLPQGLSLFDAMALGTAGFTAALAIHRLEQNELSPEKGKVIVTGATGGVGSLAIQMLAQLGYQVVAMTGKASEYDYLKSLGASEILSRDQINLHSGRVLEKGQWAGALDAVGGDTLAWLTRSMQQDGAIASFGNAGGVELHTTVFPFILRGVKLLGVDSAATSMPLRQSIWQRLAGDLHPSVLARATHAVSFADLSSAFPRLLHGEARGRYVVDIAGLH
ncbi:MAG: quinone oxidoreductase [Gallionellales bacterium GWA2_60_142]|nr:MAG: quinone oxidoreductase [Gallionellales bacterium GWA2_60_142]HCI14809.1 oxidoreductase [Gallionellaceae bacterium]